MDIQAIIDAIRYNRIRITDHADEEAQADHLSFDEIFFSVLHGEIIEEYPTDKPYYSVNYETYICDGVEYPQIWANEVIIGPHIQPAGYFSNPTKLKNQP